jgi:hypothetical protein
MKVIAILVEIFGKIILDEEVEYGDLDNLNGLLHCLSETTSVSKAPHSPSAGVS